MDTCLCGHVEKQEGGVRKKEYLSHGGEQQHAVACSVQLDEQAVQRFHFAALPHQQGGVEVRVVGIAQHRVVANL